MRPQFPFESLFFRVAQEAALTRMDEPRRGIVSSATARASNFQPHHGLALSHSRVPLSLAGHQPVEFSIVATTRPLMRRQRFDSSSQFAHPMIELRDGN